MKGIEPSSRAWKARALPLSYTRAERLIVASSSSPTCSPFGRSQRADQREQESLRKGDWGGRGGPPQRGMRSRLGGDGSSYRRTRPGVVQTPQVRKLCDLPVTTDVRPGTACGERETDQLPTVGAGGFEPPTSCSQSRRANQAALRPVRRKDTPRHQAHPANPRALSSDPSS